MGSIENKNNINLSFFSDKINLSFTDKIIFKI